VIFREATEDVYAGIEWAKGSEEAGKLRAFLESEFRVKIPEDAGIGLKPISERKSKRLVRKAIRYAIENHRRSVALVHKGNIMKFTEGAFRDWGYEVARDEFPRETVTLDEVTRSYGGTPPKGKVVMKDVIADNMFQQLLTRTEDYDILATPNLNGDYLSDSAAAQIGGLGVAPGGNIGEAHAVFEPIHGTAPKYAGMDKVNPTAEILAGVMMLEYLGWRESAEALRNAVKKTIAQKVVTYDLARQMEGAKEVKCSAFADAVIENL
jgi:isocitrate dehydrogenase